MTWGYLICFPTETFIFAQRLDCSLIIIIKKRKAFWITLVQHEVQIWSMNNLSDQDFVSVYELYYGEAPRARPEPWSQSPPKKFQLRYRENVAAILQAQSQIWGGGLSTSCVVSKGFQLSTKDSIPTQWLLANSSEGFQETIAVWAYVVWNNRNQWKFQV